MKKTNVFRASAVAITVIAIAVISIVACSKNNGVSTEPYTALSSTKVADCPYTIIYECYHFRFNGIDSCRNHVCLAPPISETVLCYIDMTCVYNLTDPVFPGDPSKGGDSKIELCLPNYSQGCEWVEQLFEKYFDAGEITFTCDCPAGTPRLMEYLPEGYLPAGSYPISKHGIDAWIDITSAVQ